ncbi:M48 family metalloprotease [Marinicella meishanensis]|uniref:M48 family metalloprotease n=1 Tax=Marinicella meishanensis TaxID=2873263 RepID=UPI001CBC80C6|nr:M48 family metalloprotease [Marinicella sp. NBU2979]
MLLFFAGIGQAADSDLNQRLLQDAEQQQAQMVTRHGLHPDARWANKCQLLIEHLALERFQSCLVLDADHANAYALAHGVVMLTQGLLSQINNDHQLAHVLAHEHAHLLLDHHLQAAKKIQNPPTFFTKSRLKKFYRQLEHDADQAANEWLLAQQMDPQQIHHYYLRIEPQVRDKKADHDKLSDRIQRHGLPHEIIDPWWQKTQSTGAKAR